MNAVIYARYSSANQREESIDGQLRVCKEFAQRERINIVGTYIDRAISGTTDNRVDFQQMIKDSSRGDFQAVLVYKFDRFARNRYDSANYKRQLKKHGVKLISAQEHIPDSPEGIMLEAMLEGYAEYFSAELSQKVKRGKRENSLKCQYNGSKATLGYKIIDKKYVIDETTAPIVRKSFDMYANGSTIREIMKELNGKGLKNSKGDPFTSDNLRYMLQNKRYIGTYFCGDVVIEEGVPALIDKNVYESVQAQFAKRKLAPASSKAKEKYLLSGKAYCGYCGEKLHGDGGYCKTGTLHRYYTCRGRKQKNGCTKEHTRKDDLESLVARSTMEFLSDPELMEIVARDCVVASKKAKQENKELAMYQKQLAEVQKQKGNIVNALAQGIVADAVQEKLEELKETEQNLMDEVRKQSMVDVELTEDHVLFYLEQLRECSLSEDKEVRDKILSCFVYDVRLLDDRVVVAFQLADSNQDLHKEVFELVQDKFWVGVGRSDLGGVAK